MFIAKINLGRHSAPPKTGRLCLLFMCVVMLYCMLLFIVVLSVILAIVGQMFLQFSPAAVKNLRGGVVDLP